MEGLCACVATTFIGKSGRQLLERYSCEREPRNAKDGYAVAAAKEGVTRLFTISETRRQHSLYGDWKTKILR